MNKNKQMMQMYLEILGLNLQITDATLRTLRTYNLPKSRADTGNGESSQLRTKITGTGRYLQTELPGEGEAVERLGDDAHPHADERHAVRPDHLTTNHGHLPVVADITCI